MADDRYTGHGRGASAEPGHADELSADLSRRFFDRLRVFAARRLRDAAAAEDLAQEALRLTLEALRAGRIENPRALPAFLFQTARNACMHARRSKGREARALQRLPAAGAGGVSPLAEDPLVALVREERRRAARSALATLGESDRELLRLFYEEGLDAKEVSRRLGTTPEAVRVRKHRALSRFGQALGEEAPGGAETIGTDREQIHG
jgi:RNA polymerase sigma-70 factor (ECF subfamily)